MTAGGLSTKRLTRVRDVLEKYVDDGYGPGAIGVVARRGEVHIEAVGRLAYEGAGANTPMMADTICRVASWTKTLVAACTMSLVEDGTLRLDDPVDELLPELANMNVLADPEGPLIDTVPANRSITLRDLLTCQVGTGTVLAEPGTVPIADALNALEHGGDTGPSAEEYLRRLGNLPLIHQPGERWMYYIPAIILGVLIARATGMTLENLLRERVLGPLGMQDTTLEVHDKHMHRMAAAYTFEQATGKPVQEGSVGEVWVPRAPFKEASSGLVTTPNDFLTFASMLMAGGVHQGRRLLSGPAVSLMTTDHLTAVQKAASKLVRPPGFHKDFGWGFAVGITTRRLNLGPSVGSYGWYGKYGTTWFNDPQEDMITMLFLQTDTGWEKVTVFQDFWTAAYEAIDD